MAVKNSPCYLSRHAFFCLADNHCVFLDLRSDKYLCLGRKHTDTIKNFLNGDNTTDGQLTTVRLQDSGDSDATAIIQALVQKELLVQSMADGKPPTPVRIDTPSASLMTSSNKHRPVIGPAHIWNFFVASAVASKDLRLEPIEQTVQKVKARKSAHINDIATVDNSVMTELFGIFNALRRYYPRPYLCMFDSLALLHFLARYKIFPQWVYAVKLEPFAAHCWVQSGDLIVNDVIDNIRDYTPIMSV